MALLAPIVIGIDSHNRRRDLGGPFLVQPKFGGRILLHANRLFSD